MSNQRSESDTDTSTVADQYDALLQAAESGLILTVNDNQPGLPSSEELTVEYSNDERTEVHLTGSTGSEYRIHRDVNGELVYSQMTETGLSVEDTVITLEILGE